MMLLLMLLLLGGGAGQAAQAAEPSVRPIGAYPFTIPGLVASPDAKPKVLLWCHGAKLLGVVVPGEGRDRVGTTPQNRLAPTALLLRDGRCEPDGSGVSFGFLVPMKAWVFESVERTPPQERNAWLLHRFQGSVTAGVLKGLLVQVDVNHPGYSFRESKIEVETSAEDQGSFTDESGWHANVARRFSVGQSEP